MNNNVKIQGYDSLEKDPNTGAILLSSESNARDIRLNNLAKRVRNIEKQNEEILRLLRLLANE